PAEVVYRLVVGLGRIVTGKEKASLTGPVGIGREIGKAAHRGLDDYLYILGMLSAYLGGFNLLPIPALDGGRLMFLVYEGVARRRGGWRSGPREGGNDARSCSGLCSGLPTRWVARHRSCNSGRVRGNMWPPTMNPCCAAGPALRA